MRTKKIIENKVNRLETDVLKLKDIRLNADPYFWDEISRQIGYLNIEIDSYNWVLKRDVK